jgi:hypothetical protein
VSALDPYVGDEPPPPLTGQELEDEVAYFKRQADRRGEPYDPEWDQWLAEQNPDPSGLPHD